MINGQPRPGWRKVKTTDVLDGIITGKKDVNQALTTGAYPFFSCARDTTLFSNEAILDRDAILIAGNGSYTGHVKKYSGKFDLYQRTYALFDVKSGNDWKFLYYIFKYYFEKAHMGGSSGAAIPYITKPILTEFSFFVPDLPTQERIAAILSAYDNLIENNQRRIALLEQAARLLYREWFVHFRFPGYETAKFVDGLPEGWLKRPLVDLTTKLGSGATPRGGAGAYQDQGLTLIRSLNVYDYSFHDDGLVFLNDDQAKKLANVTVEKRDILLNITGASVARCCMVPNRHLPARVNQHVMIVRTDLEECSPFFILHSINTQQNKEKLLSVARAGGATREALTKDVVGNFKVLCPPSDLVSLFDDQVERLHEQSEILATSNAQLIKARDLLLPRLLDGRILVKV